MLKSEQLEHLLVHPIPTDFQSAAELISKIGKLCVQPDVPIGLRRQAVRRIREIRERAFLSGYN